MTGAQILQNIAYAFGVFGVATGAVLLAGLLFCAIGAFKPGEDDEDDFADALEDEFNPGPASHGGERPNVAPTNQLLSSHGSEIAHD